MTTHPSIQSMPQQASEQDRLEHLEEARAIGVLAWGGALWLTVVAGLGCVAVAALTA